MGLLVALVALRRVENGAPGKEFGVLSVPAPTYADQLRVAALSLRNEERRICRTVICRAHDGFLTPEFFMVFSKRWAPADAENDPHGLNANHSRNLVMLSGDYAGMLRDAVSKLG